MKNIKIFMLILCVICILPTQVSAADLIVTEAEGIGANSAEALADARRKAVELAIGVVNEGRTDVIDGEVKESILQLSRAFIEKFERLSERSDKGKFYVKAKFWMERKNLLSGTLQDSSKAAAFDGAGLFTKAISRERKIKDAVEILSEIFGAVKVENYVLCEAKAENFSSGKLSLKVNFLFDRERYFSEFVPQITSVLDYVSESRQVNVPLLLKIIGGKTVTVTPPPTPKSLQELLSIMEMRNGNRYINVEETSGFANIYILTKNYYFNCYRVPNEVFRALVKNFFYADKQGRMSGKIFQNDTLRISFKDKNGNEVYEFLQELNLDSILFLSNLKNVLESKISEEKHALFMLPYIATESNQDYNLIERDVMSLNDIKVAPNIVNATDSISCEIVVKRK